AEFAATVDQLPERIRITQPLTAMVKGNFRRITSHAPSAAQADRIRSSPFETIEPKLPVEFAWIVLNERELRPAHRFVHPGGRGRRRRCADNRSKRRNTEHLSDGPKK